MMIYWILALIILLLIWIIVYLWNFKKLNNVLTEEVLKTKQNPIIIGKVTKYKEQDLDLLLSNPEVIDLLISIYEYKIFVKTDSIRSSEDTEKKIWYLDALHEMHLFFYKIKQKLNKKENKVWQSLV